MSAGWQDRAGDRSTPSRRSSRSRRRPRRAPFGTVEQPLPLIIDSDPGLDDALAIGLAVARPETRRPGRDDGRRQRRRPPLHRERAASAARLRARRHPGRRGGRRPAGRRASSGRPRSTARAGSGRRSSSRRRRRRAPRGPSTLIARLLRDHPEPVAIAPIGPLTNIALLLRLHPELAARIAHLSIMGGSIGEGNTHGLGRVQHLRRSRGRRRRLPLRRPDHDDGSRRHPPGAARPRFGGGRSARRGTTSGRIAAELTEYALDRNLRVVRGDRPPPSTTRWPSPTSRSRDLVDVAAVPRRRRHDRRARSRPDRVRRAAVPTAARWSDAQRRRRDPDRSGPLRGAADRRLREAAVGGSKAAGLRYVALGDSYTIGTSVRPAERFPDQLVAALGAVEPSARARRQPRGQRLHVARPHPRGAAGARRPRPGAS